MYTHIYFYILGYSVRRLCSFLLLFSSFRKLYFFSFLHILQLFLSNLSLVFITFDFCRFLRRAPPPSRTTVYGWGTRVEPVTTICTRSTVTPLWTVLLNRCTLRWLLVTGSVRTASRSSRLPPSRLSFARGRAPSSSTIPKSSSRWSSRRLGRQVGSSRPPTRPPGLTCLFSFVALKIQLFYVQFCYFSEAFLFVPF